MHNYFPEPLLALPDRRSPRPAILYLHIPKSAGTSLQAMFTARFENSRRYAFDFSPEVFAAFEALREDERGQFDLLMGHYLFGLHRLIPRPALYVTFLRDPVKRVVSYYNHIRNIPSHPLHAEVAGRNISLRDCIQRQLSVEFDNLQTRMIGGGEHPFGQLPEDYLDCSLDNLRNRIAFCGVVERLDESLLLLRKVMGWKKPPRSMRLNVAQRKAELSQADLDAVRERCQLDFVLYEQGKVRLDRDLAEAGITPGVVAWYRAMGRLRRNVAAAREKVLAVVR